MHQQRSRNIGVWSAWAALGCIVLVAGHPVHATKLPHGAVADAACHTSIALVDEAGIDDSQIRIVIRQVEQIWTREGVGFSWLHNTGAGEGGLTVVIQQGTVRKGRGPLAQWRHVLGSVPVSSGQMMPRISVSLGSVRSLLLNAVVQGRPLTQRPQRLREDLEAQALGRVIAHEIGHYRLRFYGHTATGLMRAVFSTEDLLDREVSRFRLERSLFRPAPGGTLNGGERTDCRR